MNDEKACAWKSYNEQIADAVAAETERCAKIADNFARAAMLAVEIASNIREKALFPRLRESFSDNEGIPHWGRRPQGLEIGDLDCVISKETGISDADEAVGVILTRDELLVILIEECSEVIKASTKCLRFGFDENHIAEYGVNSCVLSCEVGDLFAIAKALPLKWELVKGSEATKIRRASVAKAKYGVKQ